MGKSKVSCMLERLERTPVANEVLGKLKKMIEKMSINDRLPSEHQLMNDLGISRQTAREALITLQAEGYVKILRGKGAFVADKQKFDEKKFFEWVKSNELQIQELIEIRCAIEPLAASLAALRITEEELRQLEKIYTDFNEAILNGNVEEIVELDGRFHNLILEASKNKGLTFIYSNFMMILNEYRSKAFSHPANPLLAIEAHKRIFTAIENRDEQEAFRAMIEHLKESQENVTGTADEIATLMDDRIGQ